MASLGGCGGGQSSGFFEWTRSAFDFAVSRSAGEAGQQPEDPWQHGRDPWAQAAAGGSDSQARAAAGAAGAGAAAESPEGSPQRGALPGRRSYAARLRVDPEHGAGIEVSFLPGVGYLLESVAEVPGQPELCAGHVIVGLSVDAKSGSVAGEDVVSLALLDEDEADEALAAHLVDGVELHVDAAPAGQAQPGPWSAEPASELAPDDGILAPAAASQGGPVPVEDPWLAAAARAPGQPQAPGRPGGPGGGEAPPARPCPGEAAAAGGQGPAADEWAQAAPGPPEEVLPGSWGPAVDEWAEELPAAAAAEEEVREVELPPASSTAEEQEHASEASGQAEETDETVAPFFSGSASSSRASPPSGAAAGGDAMGPGGSGAGCLAGAGPEALEGMPMPAFMLAALPAAGGAGAVGASLRSLGAPPPGAAITSCGVPSSAASSSAACAKSAPDPAEAPPSGAAIGEATLQCKVRGLWEWLCEMRLQEYHGSAVSWCVEMGAASLDEVAENIEDLAEAISLRPIERQRVQKWAAHLLRQPPALPAGAAAGGRHWQPDGAPASPQPPAPAWAPAAAVSSEAVQQPLPGAAAPAGRPTAPAAPVHYAARTVRLAMDSRGNTGLDLSWDEEWGILVRRVDPLPGQLGLAAGDYIVAIDGCPLRHRSHADCDALFKERLRDGVALSIATPEHAAAAVGAPIPPRGQYQPAQAAGRGRDVPPRSPWQLARPGQGRRGGYDANRMWAQFRGPRW